MNKPTKYYSAIQEKRIASYLDWDVVTGSGARDHHPGDLISEEWLGECKTHVSPGQKIIFNYKVWKKISDEAKSKFRYPALFVDDGSQRLDRTWCIFPYNLLSLPECAVIENLDAHSANLTFSHEYLKAYYAASCEESNCIVIWSFVLGDSTVGLVPLSTFQELFGKR